jgi:D-sedoheptulose 7-phosphate isomerase
MFINLKGTKLSMLDIVRAHLKEHREVLDSIEDDSSDSILRFAKKIISVIRKNGTIFWCGNGGSASDSMHISAELIGRFKKNRIPLKSISLSSDISAITCIANDFGYDEIFSRQLQGLGKEGDILVAISTSGESQNIINAITTAKTKKISSYAFLGKGGGRAIRLVDDFVNINSNSTARVQEMHITIGHILCDLIEEGLGIN